MNKNTKHLLLVDDDTALIQALELILIDEGYNVTKTENGLDALALLKSGVSPDAIIIDYRLPGLDGLSVVKKVRKMKRLKQTPVIVMSASTNLTSEVFDLGANDFLAKPFDVNFLLSRLSSLL